MSDPAMIFFGFRGLSFSSSPENPHLAKSAALMDTPSTEVAPGQLDGSAHWIVSFTTSADIGVGS